LGLLSIECPDTTTSRLLIPERIGVEIMKSILASVGLLTATVIAGCSSGPSPEELARQALEAPSEEEQDRAAAALADLGETGLPQMQALLAHSTASPRVKGRVIEGLAMARDWDSIPALINAMESNSLEVRGRAGSAVTALLGADFGFRAKGSPASREQAIRAIRAEYERMRDHPPPGYHTSRNDRAQSAGS
jgi:hypothetical protein